MASRFPWVYREQLAADYHIVIVMGLASSSSFCIRKTGSGHRCWVLLTAEPRGYRSLQEAVRAAFKGC